MYTPPGRWDPSDPTVVRTSCASGNVPACGDATFAVHGRPSAERHAESVEPTVLSSGTNAEPASEGSITTGVVTLRKKVPS